MTLDEFYEQFEMVEEPQTLPAIPDGKWYEVIDAKYVEVDPPKMATSFTIKHPTLGQHQVIVQDEVTGTVSRQFIDAEGGLVPCKVEANVPRDGRRLGADARLGAVEEDCYTDMQSYMYGG